MCGMTETGVRARSDLPTFFPGRFVVSRGNLSKVEMYLSGGIVPASMKPLYAIRVKPKRTGFGNTP